jgi:quinol-cytochrome oxidoreductase complex cytochrome b subunit
VAVSGIYLFIFFDTGVTQAYESVEYITNVQWYAGGVMRSLHRYASDALVIVVVLHLGREYAMDRMRGRRWFAWITGVPLLWFIYACGITGYWLVWDMLAHWRTTALVHLCLRHHRLLAGLGHAGPVCGHIDLRMARYFAVFWPADCRELRKQ